MHNCASEFQLPQIESEVQLARRVMLLRYPPYMLDALPVNEPLCLTSVS